MSVSLEEKGRGSQTTYISNALTRTLHRPSPKSSKSERVAWFSGHPCDSNLPLSTIVYSD
jgi:hypothetical protein